MTRSWARIVSESHASVTVTVTVTAIDCRGKLVLLGKGGYGSPTVILHMGIIDFLQRQVYRCRYHPWEPPHSMLN